MSESYLVCKKCNEPMVVAKSKKIDVVVDRCKSCGGIYLDKGEIESFIKSEGQLHLYKKDGLSLLGEGEHNCPLCLDQIMETARLARSAAKLNYCVQCEGIFLEKGNLEKLNLSVNIGVQGAKLKEEEVSSRPVPLPDFFKNILEDRETIVWSGGPYRGFLFLLISSFSIMNILFFIYSSWSFYNLFDNKLGFIIGIAVVLFSSSFFYMVSFKNRYYVMTDERLIISSGIFGIDFKSLSYRKITDIEVSVSFIENFFGVGSIIPCTASTDSAWSRKKVTLLAVRDPYDIFKKLKELTPHH